MNSLCLSGRLVRHCEIQQVGKTNLITFTIANDDERKKTDTGWEKVTSFLDVKYFSQSGKIAKHLVKGVGVNVIGRIKQETWTQEGKKRSKVCVYAEKVEPWQWQKADDDIPF